MVLSPTRNNVQHTVGENGETEIKFKKEVLFIYDDNDKLLTSDYYNTTSKFDVLKYIKANSSFLQAGHYNLFARFDLTDDPIPRNKCGDGCCGEL